MLRSLHSAEDELLIDVINSGQDFKLKYSVINNLELYINYYVIIKSLSIFRY